MKWIIMAGALALASCGGTVVQERPTIAKVPVPQPCVEGRRPAPIAPLKQKVTREQWDARDVRQKAASIGKQGLDLRSYGESLNATTGACD